MPATETLVTREQLKQLQCLAQLSPTAFEELAGKTYIETASAGRRLFLRGREDPWIYYLLKGKAQLAYANGTTVQLKGGSAEANSALDAVIPHHATATAQTTIQFIRINRTLLEVLSRNIGPLSYQLVEVQRDDINPANRLFYALFHDYMAGTLKLPLLPEVALKVKQCTDSGRCELAEVARTLQTSPVLPGVLISIANSALYQLATPVTTCSAAVSVLGLQKTCDLVITHTLRNLFRAQTQVIADRMEQLWRHSALSGATAHALASQTAGLHAERALLLGLLHDIGAIPIIHYAGALPELARNRAQLEETINALRGQIGAMVLRKWGFGNETVEVCLDCENWLRDPQDRADYTDVVLIAQRLSDAFLEQRPLLPSVAELPAFAKLGRGRLGSEQLLNELMRKAHDEIAVIYQLHA